MPHQNLERRVNDHALFFMSQDKEEKAKILLTHPKHAKPKDSTAVSKATLEDPTHPCEWRPKTKSILVGSAQRNVPLSS